MAVDNASIIDGMALDTGSKALVLLITDHLPWQGKDAPSEYDHLLLLQDKLNAYISYLETKQYEAQYSEEIERAVIEVDFQYDIPENCKKFLNVVQKQVGQHGITIEAHITG